MSIEGVIYLWLYVCICQPSLTEKRIAYVCVRARRSSATVGVEFSTEIRGLIDKVLAGINYIVLTRLGWKKTPLDSARTAELRNIWEDPRIWRFKF